MFFALLRFTSELNHNDSEEYLGFCNLYVIYRTKLCESLSSSRPFNGSVILPLNSFDSWSTQYSINAYTPTLPQRC